MTTPTNRESLLELIAVRLSTADNEPCPEGIAKGDHPDVSDWSWMLAEKTLAALESHNLRIVPVEADFEMCESGCYDVEDPEGIEPPHSEMYHPDHGWSAQKAHDDFKARFKAALSSSPFSPEQDT